MWNSNVPRLSALFLLVLLLSGTPLQSVYADPPPASPSPQTEFVVNPIPIDFQFSPSGAILFPVKLADNTTATFLLDTGMTNSRITDSLADRMGLTRQPSVDINGNPSTVAGKSEQMVLTTLQIGSLPTSKIELVVTDTKILQLPSLVGHPIDGIIGENVLNKLPCFVDFSKKQVTFFPSSPITPQQRQSLGMQDAIGCPVTFTSNSVDSVSVQIANGDTTINDNLVIDTGSNVTMLSQQSAQQLHLPDRPRSVGHSVFGDLALSDGELTSLSFPTAGITLKGQNVVYAKEQFPEGFVANLGRDILSQFQVLLDFGAKMIYLKPRAAPVPAMPTPLLSDPTDAPVIQLTLQGQTPGTKMTGTFLIATNVLLSEVSPAMADKLGITSMPVLADDGKPFTVNGQATQAIHVPRTDLGGQTLIDTPLLVLPAGNFANQGHPVDGILGMDELRNHAFLLDMANKQVTFWGAGAFTPSDLKSVDMADAAVVPITPDETLNPGSSIQLFMATATLRHGGAEAKAPLYLFTTERSNFISADVITKLGLSPLGAPISLPGPAGTFTIAHTLISDASLGALTMKDFNMAYPIGATPPGVVPRLGIAFFSQNRVLFDFAHNIMYVKPNPSAPVSGTH